MGLKSEVLALTFGVLLILITFGDSHLVYFVGNLDTIFGLAFWEPLDVLYKFASIVVYGGLRFSAVKIMDQYETHFTIATISLMINEI